MNGTPNHFLPHKPCCQAYTGTGNSEIGLDTEEKVFVDVFSKHKKQRKVCLQFFKIDARSRFGGYWVQCAGEKRLNTANCFEAPQLLQLSKLTTPQLTVFNRTRQTEVNQTFESFQTRKNF